MSIWQALPRNRFLAELSLWSADLAHRSRRVFRGGPGKSVASLLP